MHIHHFSLKGGGLCTQSAPLTQFTHHHNSLDDLEILQRVGVFQNLQPDVERLVTGIWDKASLRVMAGAKHPRICCFS